MSVGIAMLCGTIVYLGLSGFDTSIAAETVLQGLFNSYTLLAIPLFILAADIMNAGSLADRLLRFSQAIVRTVPRRARPRQCRLIHHFFRHVGFSGPSGLTLIRTRPSREIRGVTLRTTPRSRKSTLSSVLVSVVVVTRKPSCSPI